MRIDAQDPDSGRKFSGVASDLDEDTIDGFFNSFNLSDEEIRSWISRLDISADAKSILYKIAKRQYEPVSSLSRLAARFSKSSVFCCASIPTRQLD